MRPVLRLPLVLALVSPASLVNAQVSASTVGLQGNGSLHHKSRLVSQKPRVSENLGQTGRTQIIAFGGQGQDPFRNAQSNSRHLVQDGMEALPASVEPLKNVDVAGALPARQANEAGGFYDEYFAPGSEQDENLWTTKLAVLTPGDHVEYKIKLAKGETLMASAVSDAFDPALQVSSGGKVLAKNDDRAEGNQSPFLIFRAPTAGTYSVKVLSSKSAAGGRFAVRTRVLASSDAPLDKEMSHSEPKDADRIVVRAILKKGQVYDLRSFTRASGNSPAEEIQSVRITGPTGVEANDFAKVNAGDNSLVLKALADGDYYLEFQPEDSVKFYSDFRPADLIAVGEAGAQSGSFQPGQVKVFEFPVEPNQIVHTIIAGKDLVQGISAPDAEDDAPTDNSEGAYASNKAYTWFNVNKDSELDVVPVFHSSGKVQIAIRCKSDAAQTISLTNSASLPMWTADKSVAGHLSIGDSGLYLVNSKKAELMRVKASSDSFQPKLEIFKLDGSLANTLCDRAHHTAADDLYFADQDTFIIRFSCDGDGGKCDYKLASSELGAATYELGSAQAINLDGQNFGLYAVHMEAGKRYELVCDEPGKDLKVDLLDADGQFYTVESMAFDKVSTHYVVVPTSGSYRLWLRGEPGLRHFKFQLHVPPTVN